jgi:hypothetical protein
LGGSSGSGRRTARHGWSSYIWADWGLLWVIGGGDGGGRRRRWDGGGRRRRWGWRPGSKHIFAENPLVFSKYPLHFSRYSLNRIAIINHDPNIYKIPPVLDRDSRSGFFADRPLLRHRFRPALLAHCHRNWPQPSPPPSAPAGIARPPSRSRTNPCLVSSHQQNISGPLVLQLRPDGGHRTRGAACRVRAPAGHGHTACMVRASQSRILRLRFKREHSGCPAGNSLQLQDAELLMNMVRQCVCFRSCHQFLSEEIFLLLLPICLGCVHISFGSL